MPRSSLAAELVVLHGPDAIAFAQSQFTCNVAALTPGHWCFGAWLDAHGRVLVLFQLARAEPERLLLLLRGGTAQATCQALRRYVFRARLQLDAPAGWSVGDAPAQPLHQWTSDGNDMLFGGGNHAMRVSPPADDHAPQRPDCATTAAPAWRLEQLRAGWPWLAPALAGALLPPWLALERLGAIAFDKGCYPGQEIVARLHWRGGNKRHLHHARLSAALTPGNVLRAADQPIGEVVDCLADGHGGYEALLVLHGIQHGAMRCTHDGAEVQIEGLRDFPS